MSTHVLEVLKVIFQGFFALFPIAHRQDKLGHPGHHDLLMLPRWKPKTNMQIRYVLVIPGTRRGQFEI